MLQWVALKHGVEGLKPSRTKPARARGGWGDTSPLLQWQPGQGGSRPPRGEHLGASSTPAVLGPPRCWEAAGQGEGQEAGQSYRSVCRRQDNPRLTLSHTPHNTPKSIASYYYNINIQYSYNNTIDFLLRGCT